MQRLLFEPKLYTHLQVVDFYPGVPGTLVTPLHTWVVYNIDSVDELFFLLDSLAPVAPLPYFGMWPGKGPAAHQATCQERVNCCAAHMLP
ncbi:MAG TPA: hypothetical protein VGD98_12495 [Ktedonobacteraceae bacterium]